LCVHGLFFFCAQTNKLETGGLAERVSQPSRPHQAAQEKVSLGPVGLAMKLAAACSPTNELV
jgi:hypothetical protein